MLRAAATRTVFLVCTLGPVFCPGCASYRPADPARPSAHAVPLRSDAWPDWDTEVLAPVREQSWIEMDDGAASNGGDGLVYDGFLANGLLRVSRLPEFGQPEMSVTGMIGAWPFPVFPNASFLIPPTYELRREIDLAVATVTPPEQGRVAPKHPDQLAMQGSLSLRFRALPEDPRGILISFPSMYWNQQENAWIERLQSAGWAVVVIGAKPQVTPPNAVSREFATARQTARALELSGGNEGNRVGYLARPDSKHESPQDSAADWAQARAEFPMPDNGFTLTDETSPAELGADIAHAVNNTLAAHAYAAEAAVRFLDRMHPELADRPIAVVGLSAGSLVAPTAAARLREQFGDRLAALVVMAGGADLFRIARDSTLTDGGIRLTSDRYPHPDPARVEQTHQAYLASAALDPFHAAAALTDLPVLVVRARRDQIIPHATGKLLAERLGGPDQIVVPGGHLHLFRSLMEHPDRIIRWLDSHTTQPTGAS